MQSNSDSVLKDSSIDSIIDYIKTKNITNIIVMAGAGISTAAGIPDFRSPVTGLYSKLKNYNLPYPEAVFDIRYFYKHPKPFYTLAKELYPGNFTPTKSHYFIKLLADKGLLLRCYTQNIDGLEKLAGVSEEFIVEAHGTFTTASCVGGSYNPHNDHYSVDKDAENEDTQDIQHVEDDESDTSSIYSPLPKGCGKTFPEKHIKSQIFNDEIPICPDCNGLIKPDIVFFGENLPDRFYNLVHDDFRKCELLIIMGTSLKVHPFAGLIDLVRPTVPRLLINNEVVGVDSLPHRGLDFVGLCGSVKRDAKYIGSCDDGVQRFVDLMRYKKAFNKLTDADLLRYDSYGCLDDDDDEEDDEFDHPPPYKPDGIPKERIIQVDTISNFMSSSYVSKNDIDDVIDIGTASKNKKTDAVPLCDDALVAQVEKLDLDSKNVADTTPDTKE